MSKIMLKYFRNSDHLYLFVLLYFYCCFVDFILSHTQVILSMDARLMSAKNALFLLYSSSKIFNHSTFTARLCYTSFLGIRDTQRYVPPSYFDDLCPLNLLLHLNQSTHYSYTSHIYPYSQGLVHTIYLAWDIYFSELHVFKQNNITLRI